MNQISQYLMSIDRPPYVGYTHTNDPVFTDEDGLNSATSIREYANNLGFE